MSLRVRISLVLCPLVLLSACYAVSGRIRERSRFEDELLKYYQEVVDGTAPTCDEARRNLLAAREGSMEEPLFSTPGTFNYSGEPREFITVISGDITISDRTFDAGGESLTVEIVRFSNPVHSEFSRFMGRPRMGWTDISGDTIVLDIDAIADAVEGPLSAAAGIDERQIPSGITPSAAASNPTARSRLARWFYEMETARHGEGDSLVRLVEEETIEHESQHVIDMRDGRDLSKAHLEYRGMLRGMAYGDVPYLNIGRLVLALGNPPGNAYSKASFVLLRDLIHRFGLDDIAGLKGISPEDISEEAARLLAASDDRFWFEERADEIP